MVQSHTSEIPLPEEEAPDWTWIRWGSCSLPKRWNMTLSAQARRAGFPPIFDTAMRGHPARPKCQGKTRRGVRD